MNTLHLWNGAGHGPSAAAAALVLAVATFVGRAAAAPPDDAPAAAWLDEAYHLKAAGSFDEAVRAFQRARSRGASPQLVLLEIGYVAAQKGDADEARARFEAAARGPDAAMAKRASDELAALAPTDAEPGHRLLDEAYRCKSDGDFACAQRAFEGARSAGADRQLVAIELGYVSAARGDEEGARASFGEASQGPDRALSEQAHAELAGRPRHLWADAYAEAYGWNRVHGAAQTASLVPTLRLRAFVRPVLAVDAQFYVYSQTTRDTASRGAGVGGVPAVYADDYALLGGGLLVRLWQGRIGLFAQAGPAFDLLQDGRERVAVDARGGAVFYAETGGCVERPVSGAALRFTPCVDGYAEGIYVSRFNDNVIAFARPRVAASYLVTGPVAWQLALEARAAKDANRDYYNNFVDAGAGPRWRLLAPLRIDLFASANAGSYFGVSGRDPAPSRLGYTDLRVQLATYTEF